MGDDTTHFEISDSWTISKSSSERDSDGEESRGVEKCDEMMFITASAFENTLPCELSFSAESSKFLSESLVVEADDELA